MITLRNIIFFSIILFLQSLSAQDNKNVEEGDWMLSSRIGFGTLEVEDVAKTNATVAEVFLGREFLLSNQFSLYTGLEFSNVNSNFANGSNQNLFLSNDYLSLPINLRISYDDAEKLSLYADFGIYGSYLLKSTVEIEADDLDDSENGLGFNFGYQVAFGAKYKFQDSRYSINFGLRTKNDLINSYKSSEQEFQINDVYLIEIGLGFAL